MRKTLQIIKISFTRLSREIDIDNGDTITNRYDIANTFNNYFASIAETTKKSIKYSHKHFSDYLSNESSSSLFLQPTGKEEIANILLINITENIRKVLADGNIGCRVFVDLQKSF